MQTTEQIKQTAQASYDDLKGRGWDDGFCLANQAALDALPATLTLVYGHPKLVNWLMEKNGGAVLDGEEGMYQQWRDAWGPRADERFASE